MIFFLLVQFGDYNHICATLGQSSLMLKFPWAEDLTSCGQGSYGKQKIPGTTFLRRRNSKLRESNSNGPNDLHHQALGELLPALSNTTRSLMYQIMYQKISIMEKPKVMELRLEKISISRHEMIIMMMLLNCMFISLLGKNIYNSFGIFDQLNCKFVYV